MVRHSINRRQQRLAGLSNAYLLLGLKIENRTKLIETFIERANGLSISSQIYGTADRFRRFGDMLDDIILNFAQRRGSIEVFAEQDTLDCLKLSIAVPELCKILINLHILPDNQRRAKGNRQPVRPRSPLAERRIAPRSLPTFDILSIDQDAVERMELSRSQRIDMCHLLATAIVFEATDCFRTVSFKSRASSETAASIADDEIVFHKDGFSATVRSASKLKKLDQL